MKVLSAFLVCCLLVPQFVEAEDSQYLFEHKIESKYPKESRSFAVQLPKSYYSQDSFKYPVLYVLDGENNIGFSSAVAEYLADNGLVPEMIVVGVNAGANRDRDYLPARSVEGTPTGAGEYLKFLENELIPFVEKKYRSAPLRILSGHSYGGLLGFYSMVKAPGIFNGYLIQSPYLDSANGDAFVEHLGIYWKSKRNGEDLFVFMNLGEEPNLNANFTRLEKIMTSNTSNSQRLIAKREPEKSHMTTRLPGLVDGLEGFYSQDWPLSEQQITSLKPTSVEEHVNRLSEKYGYDVLYSQTVIGQAIQVSISKRDFDTSIGLADFLVRQRPKSVLGHFFLAVSYASKGDRNAAKKNVDKAIELFEANPQPEFHALYPQMNALRLQLN